MALQILNITAEQYATNIIKLNWSNPSDSTFSEVIILRRTDQPSLDLVEEGSVVVYRGKGTEIYDYLLAGGGADSPDKIPDYESLSEEDQSKWLKGEQLYYYTFFAIETIGDTSVFSRTSIAYDSDSRTYGSNVPRYINNGLFIEEGTTNLLTANQASAEASLAGITLVKTGSGTMTRSPEKAKFGSFSVKLTKTGGFTYGRFYNAAITGGQTYTASAWVYTVNQTVINMVIRPNTTGYIITKFGVPANKWTQISRTYTFSATDTTTTVDIGWENSDVPDGAIYYVDGVQLEQKTYSTSWQSPETSRDFEKLLIPIEGLSQSEGTVEIVLNITDSTKAEVAGLWKRVFHNSGLVMWRTSGGTWWSVTIPNHELRIEDTLMPLGITRIKVAWKNGKTYAYFNDVLVGSMDGTPVFSNADKNLSIGSDGANNHYLNTIFYKVRLSSIARLEASGEPTFDEHTIKYYDFTQNQIITNKYHASFGNTASISPVKSYKIGNWLYNQLPAVYINEDSKYNNYLERYLKIIGTEFDYLFSIIKTETGRYLNPLQLSGKNLLNLAKTLGWELDQSLPLITQRRIVKNIINFYKYVGTKKGILALIRYYTYFDAEIYLVEQYSNIFRTPYFGLTEADDVMYIDSITPNFDTLDITAIGTATDPLFYTWDFSESGIVSSNVITIEIRPKVKVTDDEKTVLINQLTRILDDYVPVNVKFVINII